MSNGDLKILDFEFLCEISGGDTEFEEDLIQTFLDTAPALQEDLANALVSQDRAKATHAAHTLKGSAQSIGANQYAEECRTLETLLRSGEWPGPIHQLESHLVALNQTALAFFARRAA